MKLEEISRGVRALARSGLLTPRRPDRLARALLGAWHWGMTLAAAYTSSAARFEDRVAIVDELGPVTYRALDDRSNALAHGLRALGVDAGTVVGVMCRNHRYFADATGACSKLGAHVLYLNTSFSVPQLREVLVREHAGALIVDDEFHALLENGFTGTVVRAWIDDDALGDARGVAEDLPTVDGLVAANDVTPLSKPAMVGRTIILTSGTTGAPKGANRNHTAAAAPALAMLDRIPYHTEETMVIAAPLFHTWGFGNFTIGLVLGNTMVLTRRFDPEGTLAAIERHHADVLVAVPVMLQRILELPPDACARHDTSSLRLVPLSGSALPGGMAPRWMRQFGPNLYNLYGSTEVGYATVATPEDLRVAPGTAGKPPAGAVVKVLDDDGHELPPGRTGHIFVRNALLFDGYTGGGSKRMVDGMMSTGDTGHFDENGRLFVEGRDDEMIVSGGENVFPREVEDLLTERDDIEEAAVIGVPDDEFGQRLKAFIVRAPGSTVESDEVRNYVRENLARFKVPRDIVFVESLPRNATGKVLKRSLS